MESLSVFFHYSRVLLKVKKEKIPWREIFVEVFSPSPQPTAYNYNVICRYQMFSGSSDVDIWFVILGVKNENQIHEISNSHGDYFFHAVAMLSQKLIFLKLWHTKA